MDKKSGYKRLLPFSTVLALTAGMAAVSPVSAAEYDTSDYRSVSV